MRFARRWPTAASPRVSSRSSSPRAPWWAPRSIATAFFLIGIYVLISAERRACAVHDRLHAHKVVTVRDSRLRAIAFATSAAVAALIATVWLLPL